MIPILGVAALSLGLCGLSPWPKAAGEGPRRTYVLLYASPLKPVAEAWAIYRRSDG